MRGGAVDQALSRLEARLDPSSPAPVAVALSGGGDSIALLLIARLWANARGRRLIAMTVDHGLQPAGAAWAAACAALCQRLGVDHVTLAWKGPKPQTGVPAAARLARHRLLADAARAGGAGVILMGHTADDLAEAAVMRAEGSSVPDPREWSPSPVWPEGRGIFLLRPLLGVRRAALRGFLEGEGEVWIEDPANEDLRYARARARQSRSHSLDLAQLSTGRDGIVHLFQEGLGAFFAPGGAIRDGTVLSAAIVCAGGGERLPRARSIEALMQKLGAAAPFAQSLAGARITAKTDHVLIAREPGEYRRRGLAPQGLPPGRPLVWDGRFEVMAHRKGLAVAPLAGLAARLPKEQQTLLKALPAVVRQTLPAVLDGDRVTCPILAEDPRMTVSGLVFDRFCAAIGLICREASFQRVAEAVSNP